MNGLPATPRRGVYHLYWYFAAERQRVFEARLRGDNEPWTDDTILQSNKFCNVYRASDRVSQYLIRDVIYASKTASPDDLLFQIVMFRIFSRPETWKNLIRLLGRSPVISDLERGRLERALTELKNDNKTLYTGAFILCANDAFGRGRKHLNHVELLKKMFLDDEIGVRLLGANSLEQVFNQIHAYPLMGDFMSYQIAVDLNYSDLFSFSENDFVKAGPGSKRGIEKVFENAKAAKPSEIIMWMVDNQEREFSRLGYSFNGLFGRPLHAIDCQGLFCEVDKYCRLAVPELKSARKRIKAKFQRHGAELKLFFPPKWGINDAMLNSGLGNAMPGGTHNQKQYKLAF